MHFKFIYTILTILLLLTGCTNETIDKQNDQINKNNIDDHITIVNEDSYFEVTFIDVGQADAIFIECDGESLLVDGGNREDSNLIYKFLENKNITDLNYMVATHAHEDHIGGLIGAFYFSDVKKVMAPTDHYDSKTFNKFMEAIEKEGSEFIIPKPNDVFYVGSAKVQVLAPLKETNKTNNTSIVLRVDYQDTSMLLTGDAEYEEEMDILDSKANIDVDLLKVGHHGSNTSTSYRFLREVMPSIAVIQCGKNNDYGHPHEEVLSRLHDADVKVYRTDLNGDVICRSDGVKFACEVEKVPDEKQGIPKKPIKNEVVDKDGYYILNTNTMKFHYPSCSSVKDMKDENKEEYHGERDKLIEMGYEPCGKCKP